MSETVKGARINSGGLKVLLVEDNPGDARLIREYVREEGQGIVMEEAGTLSQSIERLGTAGSLIDIVLLDLSLPDSHGFDTFLEIHRHFSQMSIIILTGRIDDEMAVRAVREGAQDYLVKGQIDGPLLVRAIRYAVERKKLEETLRFNENRLEGLLRLSQYKVESVHDFLDYALNEAIILTKSKIGYILFYNEAKKEFNLDVWSKNAMQESELEDRQKLFKLEEAGLWGEAVQQRGPLIMNEFQPSYKDGPAHIKGCADLNNILVVPVFMDDRIVAVVGVADKTTDYDESDVRQLTLLVNSVWKITERKSAETMMRKAAEEWRLTFDSMDDMIFILDKDFKVMRLNLAASLLLGRHYTEVVGSSCFKFMHVNGEKPALCPVAKMFATRRHEEVELYLEEPDIWLSAAADPIIDENGKIAGAVHILKNITEHKKAEKAIQESEQKYRDIFENATEGIFQISPEGKFININPALARMFGFETPDEMLSFDDAGLPLIRKEDGIRIQKKLMQEGKVDNFEIQARTKKRTLIWFSIHSRAVKDAEGRMLYAEGSALDITERKKSLEAIKQSEMKYKGLFDHANEAILLIQESRFVDCNSRAPVFFGCGADEIIGEHPHVFMPPFQANGKESKRELVHYIMEAVSGRPQIAELKFMRKDGSIVEGEVSLSRLMLGDDLFILVLVRDITPRKKAEETLRNVLSELESKNAELEQAYDDLKVSQQNFIQQEKMASIGQLAAGVAHEINNPVGFVMSNINSMGKYVERLTNFISAQSGMLGELQQSCPSSQKTLAKIAEKRKAAKVDYILEDMNNIVKECLEGTERVKRIVQDLKSFSRIDENEYKLSDINKGLESTINVVWNELKYKATVMKNFGDIPHTMCNLGQLNQVFMNLLINAVQAIDAHGEIAVETRNENGNIVISVSDTGCGIPEDKRHRIFEPFYTTKGVGKGTGLGLSIAYDIIKKHNGDIVVVSEIGKGTVFKVTIPAVAER